MRVGRSVSSVNARRISSRVKQSSRCQAAWLEAQTRLARGSVSVS